MWGTRIATGDTMPAFTDCEVRDGWFFQQDVNAWTSLAYVVAAVIVLATTVRKGRWRAGIVLTLMLSLEGAGSVLYHGTSAELGEALHDIAIVGILGFLAGWHSQLGEPSHGAALGAIGGFAVAALVWWPAEGAADALVVAGLGVMVGGVLCERRHGVGAVMDRRLLALVTLALAAWAAGMPDSPLCVEASVLQPHALWHLLSAAAIVRWTRDEALAQAG